MDEDRFEEALVGLMRQDADELEDWGVTGIESFAAAGILTTNSGIVVDIDDGSQFQVTIVRSRRPLVTVETRNPEAYG